ncbi:hypothetical protein FOA52_009130, partial [Chlamydomonas sp. UWO 241]
MRASVEAGRLHGNRRFFASSQRLAQPQPRCCVARLRTHTVAAQGNHASTSTSSSAPAHTPFVEDLAGALVEPEEVWPEGVSEKYWLWTFPGSSLQTRVRYFEAGTSGPPLLLLHGFGVGAYHYERNIAELSKACRVYAVDVLGQGSSWPVRAATAEDGLYISVDTWRQQLADFAVDVMKVGPSERCYVAGNSLGGLLAVQLAALRPELVAGLVLLNATPFWSFRPSLSAVSQGVWAMLPAGFGSVPVPQKLKDFIGKYWWDTLRRPGTIRTMLQLVYSDAGSVDEGTVKRILKATEQPLALDVFAAIALAPKP